LTALLTVFAIGVAGYHPYAEDGGVYVAGVKKLLDPSLYPTWTEFVTEHLRFSVFAPVVAEIVRATHASLPWVLFALYGASVWATLFGGWMVIARVTGDVRARSGAVALLACWVTLPIAGTSLMLVDPYVTARGFTTPLVLMALAWTTDALQGRRAGWMLCSLAIMAAAALHPLMAGYGLCAVAVLVSVSFKSESRRRWAQSGLIMAAIAVGTLVRSKAPAESPEYVRIALTRYYWFPEEWHWYEWIGLIAPLAILHSIRNLRLRSAWRDLAQAGIQVGWIALLVAWLFSRADSATLLVARLQPLRSFQIVYELMILLLGAWLGERVLKTHAWRWALLFVGLGAAMFFTQRSTYPNSGQLEWPWAQPVNPWEQAFVWVRDHTPKDALFALDAHYITQGKHEDAQCFRAIAERSALPDYSKDGGEASITPALTSAWVQGQEAQTGLESQPDAERLQKLRPLGVSWVVLEADSKTGWNCPYKNATVKVCRLP
jgi:hypothetical protein